VLIAEDSPTQAARLMAALEDQGFEVVCASEGAKALKLFSAGDFDLVLSDVVMPGMTGYELCRAIKNDRDKAHVPVVLLTSLSDPMDVIRGLECGADNFVRKPYDAGDLIARIERILASVRARRDDPLSAGLDIVFLGNRFSIKSDRAQILDLLISIFEETIRSNRELELARSDLIAANAKLANHAEQLETRVRERTIELGTANDSLRAEMTARQNMEKQLVHAQKMEAIGTLTGGIAHDFNNLLGVVIGNLDLMQPMIEPLENGAALRDDALDAALRGAELTRRLLAFARRQPLNPERIDVNQLVGETAKLLQRVLGEAVEIALELEPEIWPVVVDPAQLESSLMNLATNARDAMPNGGKLRVVTRNRTLDADYVAEHPDVAPGDYAMIAVADTGHGMPPDILARVFEPFFTTKENFKGTGLGLAMVFGFMKQSAGHINVYSEVGAGTVFRLYIPCAATCAAEVRVVSTEPTAEGQGETVLAVEDNAAMRRVATRQLRALNYRVIEAESAATALEILGREKVDLVLSDIIMPGGMSGAELARTIATRWPNVRILLTSGFAAPLLLSELEPVGRARVLSKPYRRNDLARELREALGGQDASSA
jgi:signal transduction histidine kinase